MIIILIIMKEISTAAIFHIKWKHRALYNSNSNTYTPMHACMHPCTHPCMHAHMHAHTKTHTQTHTHTNTTHTHKHTTHRLQREKTDRLETVFEKVGFKSGFK